MDQLYPLKFKPILKERIWGGSKLKTLFGKIGNCERCGESWEISAVQSDISVVENGFLKNYSLEELIEVYMGELVGDKVYDQFGIEFPLLIKFIDATDDLSVQVHPNDDLAIKRHNSYGKTEMWYVLDAEPNARLISGFAKQITKEEYLKYLNSRRLKEIMNYCPVTAGDVFFIPAGRVHAIGSGILLAEIQQTSDITYRIYDWDRLDAQGKSRELHTDLALDAIDYDYVPNVRSKPEILTDNKVNLVKCEYFTTNKLKVHNRLELEYYNLDSFVIYICCRGRLNIISDSTDKIELKKGETLLIPACIDNIILEPLEESEILEVYID
jgi:mannose-6-phosphate isomerase